MLRRIPAAPARQIAALLTALALIATTLLGSATAAEAGGFRCGPHVWPQARTFVDGQGWWRDADGIDVDASTDSGHVHVGACLPDDLTMPASTTVLKIRLVLHEHTGRFDELVVVAKGWGYEQRIARVTAADLFVDERLRVPHEGTRWHGDPDGTTVRWARVRVPADAFGHAGTQQLRLRAFTRHDGERFMASLSTPWHVPPAISDASVRDYGRENHLRGKGMYTNLDVKGTVADRSYCDASVDVDHLGLQHPGWAPAVAAVDHETGKLDSPVTSHLVYVNRNEHLGVPGTALADGPGQFPASAPVLATRTRTEFAPVTVPIDGLAPGTHTLSVRTNCLDTHLGPAGASQLSGVVVIGFRTD